MVKFKKAKAKDKNSQLEELNDYYIQLFSEDLKYVKLKLKLQYFGHPMQRADLFEKTLMLGRLKAGGEGDDRG